MISSNALAVGIKNLASFDNFNPSGSLTYYNGLFYGTTTGGGVNNNGTIFSVSPTKSTITNLASFNGTNGAGPQGSLTYNSTTGLFYGTTSSGGDDNGDGTIFSVSPSGSLSNLASFDGSNGANPSESLTYNSTSRLFYGTTSSGGAYAHGTIFSFDAGINQIGAPEPLNILGAGMALSLGAFVKRKLKK